MSKNLKLVGLTSYTGMACMHGAISIVVQKGEVCRFSDEKAELVMEGGRYDKENEWRAYWREVSDDTVVNHNFTEDKIKVEKADLAALAAAHAASVAKPVQRVRMRTRV